MASALRLRIERILHLSIRGAAPADQAEARELLARINDDRPRFAVRQKPAPKTDKQGALK